MTKLQDLLTGAADLEQKLYPGTLAGALIPLLIFMVLGFALWRCCVQLVRVFV